MDGSETDGVRYELLLSGAAEQDTLSYRGSLQLGDQRYPLSVDVICDGSGADGLRVEASCPEAPERGRKALERDLRERAGAKWSDEEAPPEKRPSERANFKGFGD